MGMKIPVGRTPCPGLTAGWLVGLLCCLAVAAEAPELPPDAPVAGGPWAESLSDKFTFSILGDRTGGGLENWPIFDQAVDEINLLRPDFVIMVGDLIQGYTTDARQLNMEWNEFLEHAARLDVPLLLLPGNHDISNPIMHEKWRGRLGRTYYSFVYRDCLFLLLNTHEHFEGADASMGPEQCAWAVETLEKAAEMRHVFVFLHVPLWYGTNPEWKMIEEALGDRDYTVIAGHLHQLSHETRRDRTYLVHGPTGGGVTEQELLEMGRFHHYAMVTVEGDDVFLAAVQPGGIWPPEAAARSFQDSVARFLSIASLMPEGLDGREAVTGLSIRMENHLPLPATVDWRISIPETCAWLRLDEGTADAITLQPGDTQVATLRFAAPVDQVVPVPRLSCRALYRGLPLFEIEQNIALFPFEALRTAPTWMAVGPFDAGPLPRQLPANPRGVMSGAFIEHGPEAGYTPDTVTTRDGRTLRWQTLETEDAVAPGFVNLLPLEPVPFDTLAYAACAVYSPEARTVYASFRVDDYGQLLVNGRALDNLRVFRTRRDPDWVALQLAEGWNTIVVKAYAISGGWSFRLLFADPDNALQFAPHPPEE